MSSTDLAVRTPSSDPSAAVAAKATADALPSASPEGAISVGAFLDHVATVLKGGLPVRVWIEATTLSVRESAYGHTLELADATTTGASPPTLRAFLSTASLAAIRENLGLPIDPVLLVGLTTALLVAPSFSARWHLGGRIEALTQAASASLRQRLIDRAIADLKRDGSWDRQRRLAKPRDITRISVIHPSGAAGWQDIRGELLRWEKAGLLCVKSIEVPFEGERAVGALVAALETAVEPIVGSAPDLILIVRGGGARAGLTALDDARLVRAVCRCPIPIVAGTGHACDTTLLDRQAWQAVDTPSKALALIAGIVGSAARGASAGWMSIAAAGQRAVASHHQELALRLAQVLAGGHRSAAGLSADLAARWSQAQVGAQSARERTRHYDTVVRQLFADVMSRGTVVLDAQQGRARTGFHAGLSRATALLARCDEGIGLLSEAATQARGRLLHERTAIDRLREAVLRDARHALDRAEAALEAPATAADAHDLGAVLARGFAIVTDPAGHLVRSRVTAASTARLVLTFADGELAVLPAAAGDEAEAA